MTADEKATDGAAADSFDRIAADLRQLREQAGMPSFAQIASRIAADREARGVPPAAALPARTTVYDVFRDGRARVNADFVAEIVRALGADETAAREWHQRCARAMSGRRPNRGSPAPVAPGAAPRAPESAREPELAPAPGPGPGPGSTASDPTASDPTASDPAASDPTAPPRAPAHRRPGVVGLLLAGAIGLNLLAAAGVLFLGLPLHLDMIGTAVAALVLGPWWGAVAGASSTLLGIAVGVTGPGALPFALVQVAGALAWGYGVRALALGTSSARFLLLNVLVALVCSAVAVPILVMIFDGGVGHASESVVERMRGWGESLWLAVGASNVIISLADKLVTGFLALAVAPALVRRLRIPSTATLPPSTGRSDPSGGEVDHRP